jgi:hypothetical protein
MANPKLGKSKQKEGTNAVIRDRQIAPSPSSMVPRSTIDSEERRLADDCAGTLLRGLCHSKKKSELRVSVGWGQGEGVDGSD